MESTLSYEARVLAAAVSANLPILLWGPPGIGKSASINALFGDHMVITLTGNVRLPEDFGGIPYISEGKVKTAPPDWAVMANEYDGPVVVFLDELSTSAPAVQAAMLRVVQDRCAGEYQLLDHVRIIAAANPAHEAANGWELAPPLANRFVHLDWPVNAEAWVNGMVAGFPTERATTSYKHGWDARIAAYIHAHPIALNPGIPKDATQAGRAYATPRSWNMAAKLLAWCEPGPMTLLALTGCVGNGSGLEAITWLEKMDLPAPETVLADPTSFDWNKRRADRTFAVLAAIVSYVGDKLRVVEDRKVRQAFWDQAWRVLQHVAEVDAVDVGMRAANQLLGFDTTNSLDIEMGALMSYADLIRMTRRA